MKHSSTVPAFLTKLWTLVEDEDTNEFICWSQEGASFLVLDEQRFAKEILPKFFKHNNMASFIRQLNMYGFRKVMHIDSGIVKQERDGPVEFQHPYFKHGQDELLDNIKRKVSNARPEDNKIRHEDLTKILASVQSVHCKQENIDTRLATLKRENEALWREVSDLRQKHAHQQQLIKKLIHFIITLVQSNRILNLKRKRSLLMNSNGKKPKYIHQIYDDKACVDQMSVNSRNGKKGCEMSEDIIICDLTESGADGTAETTDRSPRAYDQGDVEIVEVQLDSCGPSADSEVTTACTGDDQLPEAKESAEDEKQKTCSLDSAVPVGTAPIGAAPIGGALQLNKPSGLSLEDPVKMMDSILSENGAISQNISLLGKVELMDYLDSIDCSLEDFQAMLYEKQFGVDFDPLEDSVSAKENSSQPIRNRGNKDNTDKRLIQYTSNPLLAFLDGYVPPELDMASTGTAAMDLSHSGTSVDTEPPSAPARSSLIRLEPLTEAEASEETLFYLCELSPAGDEADSTKLDGV